MQFPENGSESAANFHRMAHSAMCICLVALGLSFSVGTTSAQAGTTYVDGISDQSIPVWDGNFSTSYFHGFFANTWGPHVHYARWVVPWDVMKSPGSWDYISFNSWYEDVISMGLTPDVALTKGKWIGSIPATSAQYGEYLGLLLSKFTAIRFVEAWNEPNGGGGPSAVAAAHFWNSANSLCQSHNCTAIAGDFLDSQSNLVSYENTYKANLTSPAPSNWGIHPYYAVKHEEEATVSSFRANLPNGGAGINIWFTEIGAYQCELGEKRSELQQAADASWLVNRLMPDFGPMHVFYYEFLYGNNAYPACSPIGSEHPDSDTALYLPSVFYTPGGDPNAPDAPRPAANFIFGNNGAPMAYTGGPAGINGTEAELTGSVYPGGFLQANYHFDYGASPSYGASTQVSAFGGPGVLGGKQVSAKLTGLVPETTYHYRLAASNTWGSAYGPDGTFRTGPGFFLRNSNTSGGGDIDPGYGQSGDSPVVGDWNGDGKDTIGVYRPSNSTFYLRNTNTTGGAEIVAAYGETGMIPVVGDWNGDGSDTIGAYQPSNSTFYLRNSNTSGAGEITATYGETGMIPVVGDWNGDGSDTIGAYQPSNSTFYLRNSNTSGAGEITATYGETGMIPVVGDWIGQGKTTIGVYQPSNATFYLRNSNTSGVADITAQMGVPGDSHPLSGDWTGQHKDTIGLFRGQ